MLDIVSRTQLWAAPAVGLYDEPRGLSPCGSTGKLLALLDVQSYFTQPLAILLQLKLFTTRLAIESVVVVAVS